MTIPALLLGGTSRVCAAESGAKSDPAVIRVAASSTVKGKPDRALISIGVVTQSSLAQEASEQNAKQTSSVISDLKKLLGGKGEVKTAYYQLSPVYDRRQGKESTISGYSASNTVVVMVEDLDMVGKTIDAATQSGANTIQGLQFVLKDDSSLRKQALQEAVSKAKSKADAMAAAAGVKIARVLSLDEGGEVFHPMPMRAYGAEMAMKAAPTPIEAGDLDITASVNMSFEIAP